MFEIDLDTSLVFPLLFGSMYDVIYKLIGISMMQQYSNSKDISDVKRDITMVKREVNSEMKLLHELSVMSIK